MTGTNRDTPSGQRRHMLAALVLLALVATVAAAPRVAATAAAGHGGSRAGASDSPGAHLRVGSLELHRCVLGGLDRWWCGSLPQRLDPAVPADGTIRVGFGFLPARGRAQGTIVAEEGGPGFPASGTAFDYRQIFLPLLAHRNLLLIDARGTGMSQVIDCKPLQDFPASFTLPGAPTEPSAAFNAAVARCGYQINHARRLPGGGDVRTSSLYDTALDTRDMAGVIDALGVAPVDFYGDSYGSFFGQAFASRFPGLLRSLTLDSTYPALGSADYFARYSLEAARADFNAVCRLSVACNSAAPGSSWRRISDLVARLRAAPIVGTTSDWRGRRVRALVDPGTIVDLVNDAGFDPGYDPLVYRDLDAAARALLEHNDPAPLLRLAVLATHKDNGGISRDPYWYSDGLYFADTCTDYSTPYDQRAPLKTREAELAQRIAHLPPRSFAPFTVSEWLSLDAYDQALTSCVVWPALRGYRAPVIAHPAPIVPANLPVLVLGGTLDSLTSPGGAREVTRQLGPSARLVEVANTTHVTAEQDYFGCATSIIHSFILAPARLFHLEVACAGKVPPVPAVGAFPLDLAAVAPATPGPGDRAGTLGLRLAALAAATIGDALSTEPYSAGGHGAGLRGGAFTFQRDETQATITLSGDRFVAGAATSGRVHLDRDTGVVDALVTVTGPDGERARLAVSWDGFRLGARAQVSGEAGGRRVVASLPAPGT